MSEFQFRPIEIHEIKEEGGRTVIDGVTPPVCDFCSDRRVRWDYDCDDFEIPEWRLSSLGGHWASTGGFAACDACSELIESEQWAMLVSRITRAWRANGVKVTRLKIRYASTIVHKFKDRYHPPRKAFG